MRNTNFRIENGIFRVITGTVMASVIFVAATLAQTSNVNHKAGKNNVVHDTKVAGKDTARATGRAAKKTGHFTKRAAKDTGKAVGKASYKTAKTVERGSGDVAHYTKVGGEKTGRFFRRVGHSIY